MPTNNSYIPAQKKHNIVSWFGGLLLLPLPLLLMQQTGSGPAIIVSPETTYITEPLKPDGLPDYERYILERYRDGVRPEENAAILLWQSLWPGELEQADFEPLCRELGLAAIPPASTAWDSPELLKWLRSSGHVDATPDTESLIFDNVKSRPWIVNDIPPLAEWVRKNQHALDMMVAASQKPRFYSPSPTLLNAEDDPLIEVLLPGVPLVRAAGKLLALRAMGNLGDGGLDNSWRDIVAIHRFARLAMQHEFLVERMVAIQINGIACEATGALLSHRTVPTEMLRQIQHDLHAFPEFNGIAQSLDRADRVTHLDSVIRLKAGYADGWQKQLGLKDTLAKVSRSVPADWNIALRRGKEFYDLMVAAAKMPRGTLRDKALAEIDAKRDQMEKDASQRLRNLWTLNHIDRGEVFASTTIALFAPDLEKMLVVQDSANDMLRLTRLAAAIAVYESENGTYPEDLGSLVPRIIATLPVDIFSGNSFVYKLEPHGFLLYSVGPNKKDEQGSNEKSDIYEGHPLDYRSTTESQGLRSKIPDGSDDISIRFPRPPLDLTTLLPRKQSE
jgi:hypothetical protein